GTRRSARDVCILHTIQASGLDLRFGERFGPLQLIRRPRLPNDLVPAVVEWKPFSFLDFSEGLALAFGEQFEHAVMAMGVVAPPAEKDVRRPVAARAALVGVIAAPTKPVEIVELEVACEAQRFAPLPNGFERLLAEVSTDVVFRRERRATLDVAVRFDAE